MKKLKNIKKAILKKNAAVKAPWNPYFNWTNGVWAYGMLNVIYPYMDI